MRKPMWLGLLLAGVCLYFAFRGISFQQLWDALTRARPWPIFLALALYFFEYLLRSERWAVLLKPIRPIAASQLLWPMFIGYFANNVLPLRMGELIRAHLCGTKFKISRTASLGTILLERLCDTISFLTTFLVASLFYPFPTFMEKGAWLLGGACFAVIGSLLLIHQHERRFRTLLAASPIPIAWKERINYHTTHFIHSI